MSSLNQMIDARRFVIYLLTFTHRKHLLYNSITSSNDLCKSSDYNYENIIQVYFAQYYFSTFIDYAILMINFKEYYFYITLIT